MKYLVILITCIAVSITVIPIMVRLAPWLGMMDNPDDKRKVHARPTARVGGWGIVLGMLVTVLIWLPMDRLVLSYILGSVVLLIFGALDDRREMGHYSKFAGQIIAVLPVIIYADLYITSFPLLDFPLPTVVAIPFTMFAMVGVINAMNHSDGLDGLAGGEALLSLAAMSFIAYLASGDIAVTIAIAVMGGVLGFLRFNTHPALVFMGDSGSQFLGFSLAFLAVLLTQKVDPSLSPSVALLLLGLPIADILFVLVQRIQNKMNWFRATSNHIHHRLLQLGFVHKESVVLIYLVQAFLILSGIVMRNVPDWLIISLYLLVCVFVFGLLRLAEKKGWRKQQISAHDRLWRNVSVVMSRKELVVLLRRFLATAIPLYLFFGSVFARDVPWDFGLSASILLCLIMLELYIVKENRVLIHRILIYVTVAFIVFLNSVYPSEWSETFHSIETGFFILLAVIIAITVKFSPGRRSSEFHTSAMDYLNIFIVLAVLIPSKILSPDNWISTFVLYLIIILYGCEVLISETRRTHKRWDGLGGLGLSALVTTAVIAFRGLL